MKRVISRQIAIMSIFIAFLAVVLGLSLPSLFESLVSVSAKDILSQAPIAVSQRVYLQSKCSVQLYGWTSAKPRFGAADEYIEILQLEVYLDNQPIVASRRENETTKEYKWDILVPHGGNLTAKIGSYRPPSMDLNHATAFLSCDNSKLDRVPGVFLIIGTLCGMVGIAVTLVLLGRSLLR